MNETPASIAYKLCYTVNGFKNSTQRYAYTYGTIRRADAAELRVGLDWALTNGLIQYGTTNASARAWSRNMFAPVGQSGSDGLLYLTKAGKAWVRAVNARGGIYSLTYAQLKGDSVTRDQMLA